MAVTTTMEATRTRVEAALEGLAHAWSEERDGMPTLCLGKAELAAVLRALAGRAGFTSATFVTAVDRLGRTPRFELVHQLHSLPHNDRLRLKTPLAEGECAPSSIALWPGAAYMERECYDLFGIEFEGHAPLRRLLMPDEYGHHPLRKDFPHQGIEPDRLYREWDRERRKSWPPEAAP
jgi:NADH-quinone oxidoreductase subunit C